MHSFLIFWWVGTTLRKPGLRISTGVRLAFTAFEFCVIRFFLWIPISWWFFFRWIRLALVKVIFLSRRQVCLLDVYTSVVYLSFGGVAS